MIEINGLTISKGSKKILDIDHLKLESGKVTAILGPNGSGKTTLLETIALLNRDELSKIKFDGSDITLENLPQLKRSIALLLQRPTLFESPVIDNVCFGLIAKGFSKREATPRAIEMLKRLGIDHISKRTPTSLSGGERQRVCLAALLVLKPKWLLLDEPFSNIDTENREMFKRLITELSKVGVGVIYSSHRVPEAVLLSDHIYHLYEGRLSEEVMENVFTVEILKEGEERFFELARKQRIYIADDLEGICRISIDPKNLILSLKPFKSSARNMLIGKVISISSHHDLVRVEMDAGIPLHAIITHQSLEELKLIPEKNIIVSFKATAIKVIKI
ncbi:MAG: ATP-binding cassette domain-containing protein [Pseudomonadota bacterium]